MVIDRVFLIVYLLAVVGGLVWIIFQAPLAPDFFDELFHGFKEEDYDKGISVV